MVVMVGAGEGLVLAIQRRALALRVRDMLGPTPLAQVMAAAAVAVVLLRLR
jgi:hypothetical protein